MGSPNLRRVKWPKPPLSETVRAAAIGALAAARDWDAWDAVEDRLAAEKEWPVVLEAAVLFAETRCRPDAVEVLGEVVDRAQRPRPWQPDVEIAARAIRALAAIGGEEATEIIRGTLQNYPGYGQNNN